MEETANQPSQAEMMMMLEDMISGKMDPNDLANMFGNMGGDDDDFWGFDDEDEIENAKFKEGTSVKIGKNVIDAESGIDLSGLIGRVEDVYIGETLDDLLYEIELDSISLNKLPPKYIEEMVRIEEDFQNFEVSENQLKKCRARDNKNDTQSAYRKNFHQYLWNYLDSSTQKRLQKILLKKPHLLDWENWQIHLNQQLKFPIAAKSRGMLEFRKGEKLKITRLAGYNEEVGLIVDVTYRNRPGNYPLFDLIPTSKNLKQIFEDYLIWAEEMHEIHGY